MLGAMKVAPNFFRKLFVVMQFSLKHFLFR
jgi:hypothetical protein